MLHSELFITYWSATVFSIEPVIVCKRDITLEFYTFCIVCKTKGGCYAKKNGFPITVFDDSIYLL
jgi:hypothetical protein